MTREPRDDPGDKLPILGPLEDAEEEFKVFRIIENTLVGILVFIASYLKTSWLLLSRPHRFYGHVLAGPTEPRLLRPFTYLAISAFGAYVVIRYQGLAFRFSPDVIELREVSPTDVITSVLPMVAVVVLAGYLATARRTGHAVRRATLHLFCYAAGYQYLCVAVVGAAIVVYYSVVGQPGGFLAFLDLLPWWMTAGAYIAIMTFLVMLPTANPRDSRWRRVPRRVGVWVVSLLALYGGLLVASVRAGDALWAWIAPEQQRFLHCSIADVSADGDVLTVTLSIHNPGAQTLIVSRRIESAFVRLVESVDFIISSSVLATPELVAWADDPAPILIMGANSDKWATVRLNGWSDASAKIEAYREPRLDMGLAFRDVSGSRISCYSTGAFPLKQP